MKILPDKIFGASCGLKNNFTEVFWSNTSNEEIYEKICKKNVEE